MKRKIPACPYPAILEKYNAWKFSDGQPPDQDIVIACLQYAFANSIYDFAPADALPREVVGLLMAELMAVQSGHESAWFAKPDSLTKPLTHPKLENLERRAVAYVKTCKHEGWDTAPVKKICAAFDISSSTYRRWERKYPGARDDRPQPRGCPPRCPSLEACQTPAQ